MFKVEDQQEDEYKKLSNNSLERFMFCLKDMIGMLNMDPYQYDPDFFILSQNFVLFYLDICYKQKFKKDKSLSRKLIKNINKLILKRNTTLEESYKYIYNRYFTINL